MTGTLKDIVMGEEPVSLDKRIRRDLEGKKPNEVGDYFFALNDEASQLAIRDYIETKPEEFRVGFDNYVTLKIQPLAKELARISDSWKVDCA